MTLDEKLHSLIDPVCEELSFDIVRMQLQGGTGYKTLQIMIERKDLKPLKVSDCASLSRAISPILEENDPIEDAYSLEVSSPGIDRPLVRIADFSRFNGFQAKIECSSLVGNRKRFTGRLKGVENNNVLLDFEGDVVEIPFDLITKSKLVLTDDLISAFAEKDNEE